jgi:hypothetical protein
MTQFNLYSLDNVLVHDLTVHRAEPCKLCSISINCCCPSHLVKVAGHLTRSRQRLARNLRVLTPRARFPKCEDSSVSSPSSGVLFVIPQTTYDAFYEQLCPSPSLRRVVCHAHALSFSRAHTASHKRRPKPTTPTTLPLPEEAFPRHGSPPPPQLHVPANIKYNG